MQHVNLTEEAFRRRMPEPAPGRAHDVPERHRRDLPLFGTRFGGLDRLKTRIQGLRAKTTDNGCTEAEAVFRMLKRPKRDVFEFSDGRQITLGDLPAGLIFDVLVVPGSEQLSALLDMEPVVQHEEEVREKEPFLVRLLTRF